MTLPTVTVILPSYDRPDQARACLATLARLDYPAALLAISIVDDGSPIPLADALGDVACPFAVAITRQPNAGPAAARNAAVDVAQGELLAFIDDDCIADPQWVRALAEIYRRRPDALIGGKVVNALPANRYAAASHALLDFLDDHFDRTQGAAQFFTTNNMACARATFLAAGGFDTRFDRAAAEDREFGLRWRRQGRPMGRAPGAVVAHHHALTLSRYWRQHSNYGAGARQLHRVIAADAAPASRFEGIRFHCDLIAWPLRRHGAAGLATAGLLLLSQVAMVHGYCRAPRHRGTVTRYNTAGTG